MQYTSKKMQKWLVCLVALAITTMLAPFVEAADLYDLRVFPESASQTISFSGVISAADPFSQPIGKRARISGMLRSWLASSTVYIETEGASCSATVQNGEFAGTIRPASISSFSVTVRHEGQQLHFERFSFSEPIETVIVSDVDDTILVTEVTSRLKMVYNSLLKSSKTREPVGGTPELYKALASGTAVLRNPHFFYLSSSPAFLSRSLKSFLQTNGFPQGTLILKKSLTGGSHQQHKLGWLETIASRFPQMPLLLFGDSGEKDPQIYAEFAASPAKTGLIKAVVIHLVSDDEEHLQKLNEPAASCKRLGVPFITWNDPAALYRELEKIGILQPETPEKPATVSD